MSNDRFGQLDELSMGDRIRIHLQDNEPGEIGGVTIESPLETTVDLVSKRQLDEKKGNDVDGIVTRKEIYLNIPDHDDVHGEYLIVTEWSLTGEKKVRPIEAREYFKGRPGDGEYSIHLLSFEDVEVIDKNS